MSNDSTTTKTCTKCKVEKPATAEYFHRNKNQKDGLEYCCKTCKAAYCQQWYIHGPKPKPQLKEGHKVCGTCHQEFPATNEFFHRCADKKFGLNSLCKKCHYEYNRQYDKTHSQDRAAYNRQYQLENEIEIKKQKRQYRIANKERIAERMRQYRRDNRERLDKLHSQRYWNKREEILARLRQLHRENPTKGRIRSAKREARKRNLPDTFTPQQWERALDYFHGCCAVCGCQLYDLFGNVIPHADHWIPLTHKHCLGTVAENMLPLCKHCNLSKHNTWPSVWLERKFGKKKAKNILKRIEAYFEWARGDL